MLRRRIFRKGQVFLEMTGSQGQLIGELTVPDHLEREGREFLQLLAAKDAAINPDRLPLGVLAFRRRLRAGAIPGRKREPSPARG